jgi:hypothetical protein
MGASDRALFSSGVPPMRRPLFAGRCADAARGTM